MSVKRETATERKALPLASGVLDYFPDALLVVAEVSRVGNEQHHPGSPLHWDKSKSTDEADALLRHLLDRGTLDVDGLRHSGKVAWRALAMLQRELDAEALADKAPASARFEAYDPNVDGYAPSDIAQHFPYGGPLMDRPVTYRGMDLNDWDSYGGSILHPAFKTEEPGAGDGGVITCVCETYTCIFDGSAAPCPKP